MTRRAGAAVALWTPRPRGMDTGARRGERHGATGRTRPDMMRSGALAARRDARPAAARVGVPAGPRSASPAVAYLHRGWGLKAM